MGTGVIFENDNYNVQIPHENESKVVDLLLKTGLVKNKKQAFIIILVFLCVSVFTIILFLTQGKQGAYIPVGPNVIRPTNEPPKLIRPAL